ncbi:hypothetical protein [Leucobacter sp. wl10]|uniref:hypothetical protein n=1 Tax=Leucobacter sp. wl10 TaxID=2304677 RepID=UPI0013C34AD9|nr:hypothetical protein [Leucobacter sp. wl10]
MITQSVLVSAAKEFSERGYGGADMRKVFGGDHDPARVEEQRHEVANAIMDSEGTAMREAQRQAVAAADSALDRLERVFAAVGRLMADEPVVRAGMRLAAEARHEFPDRVIDPYGTWHAFLLQTLEQARDEGVLRDDFDTRSVAWALVAVGYGAKDLAAYTGDWSMLPESLSRSLGYVLDGIRA